MLSSDERQLFQESLSSSVRVMLPAIVLAKVLQQSVLQKLVQSGASAGGSVKQSAQLPRLRHCTLVSKPAAQSFDLVSDTAADQNIGQPHQKTACEQAAEICDIDAASLT